MSTANDDPLTRARAGDLAAFQVLFAPWIPVLLAYSRSICGDYHAAEDVVQETAYIAFRNLQHDFPTTEFSKWLRSIARRQALAARRALHRIELGVVEDLLEGVFADAQPDSVTAQLDALRECLEKLDGRAARAVRGHYLQGLKLADLAPQLALSVNAAKQLLFRARLCLRDCIHDRLGLEKS